jgi:hypothetical protein
VTRLVQMPARANTRSARKGGFMQNISSPQASYTI